MRHKIIKASAYALFFLLCLVAFVFLGFPRGVLQTLIIHEAKERLDVQMSMNGLSLLFPNGIQATEVRLCKKTKDNERGDVFLVDRVRARVSIIGLFLGRKNISFCSELLMGKIQGKIHLQGKQNKIKANVHALHLGKLRILEKAIKVPFSGNLGGTLALDVNIDDFKSTTGYIELTLEQGSLGQGKIKGFTLPHINFGKTFARFELKDGRAEIKSLQVESDDVEASVEGYFLLRKTIKNLSARCKIRFRPTHDFLRRNPKFKDLILLSGLNQAKRQDGFFAYSLYGSLAHPKFRAL